MKKKTKSNRKVSRSKIWLKIWKKKGIKLKDSTIDKIIAADGFDSTFGGFNKKNWFVYIKTIFLNINIKKNFEILEYGCGASAFLNFFYNKKFNLYGIDYSKELIKKAKKYFPNIKFKCGEISKIKSFNKKFNLIISHSVFHYFDNYRYAKSLMKEMLLNLDSKGYICILDIPDKDKEQKFKKELINQIGSKEYKIKYGNNTHLFYKKKFFKDFGKQNNLKTYIYNQNFEFYKNSKFRYNIFFQKKT